MAATADAVTRTRDSREAGWVNRLFNSEGSTPEYQELKFTLHRKLLLTHNKGYTHEHFKWFSPDTAAGLE